MSLSQLQDQVDFLSFLFYTTLGALQRDAPPYPTTPSFQQTPLPPDQRMRDAEQEVQRAASAVAQAVASMDEQISLLPGFTHTEPQQLQRLRELAQQDVAEGERLRNAIVAAEQWRDKVRALFKVISEDFINSAITKENS